MNYKGDFNSLVGCGAGRGRYPSGKCRPKKNTYVNKSAQAGYVRKVRSDKGSQRTGYTCVAGNGRYADGHKRAGQCKPRKRVYVRKSAQAGYVRKVRSDKGLPRKAPMVTKRKKKRTT